MKKTNSFHSFQRAIVIGGSVSGILTARVLSDCFAEVILIEKDSYSVQGPEYRKGIPQAHHQHVLLTKGREIIENLFPGFDEQLKKLGAPLADYTNDFVLFSSAGRLPRFVSDIELRLSRRVHIDWILLNYLKQMDNISIMSETGVSEYLFSNATVTGVVLDNQQQLTSDLVVDATGRGSRTPKRLLQQGYQGPVEQVIDARLGYASRLYDVPENDPADFQAVEISSIPTQNPRAAGLWRVEGNRWLLTLIGTAGHYPPLNDNEFNEFARKLSDPLVFETIQRAKPCSDIYGFRGTANRWRHYESLKQFPDGLLVIGDAYCAFSPLYGQGMTVSAMSAVALLKAIKKARREQSFDAAKLRKIYFHKASNVFKSAWLLATSEDLRWPTTTGGRPNLSHRISYKFMDALMPLSTSSPRLVRNFLRISNMSASPMVLLDPRILFQMLVFNVKKLLS